MSSQSDIIDAKSYIYFSDSADLYEIGEPCNNRRHVANLAGAIQRPGHLSLSEEVYWRYLMRSKDEDVEDIERETLDYLSSVVDKPYPMKVCKAASYFCRRMKDVTTKWPERLTAQRQLLESEGNETVQEASSSTEASSAAVAPGTIGETDDRLVL